MRSILIGVLCSVGLPALPAQVAWHKQSEITARQGHGMVFDAARGVVVTFGGEFGGRSLDDTWEWDGAGWTRRTTANRPPPRNSHAMAYDAGRQRVVLFGGADGSTRYADTWEYDGNDWRRMTTGVPPGRYWAAMTYDPVRRRCLLFGGSPDGRSALADTWEWDGMQWTRLTPAHSPSPRFGPGLCYDSARGRAVLFGGMDASFVRLGDTWEWDSAAATWVQVASSGPPAAVGWQLAFDRQSGLVFGIGTNGVSFYNSGLWTWDGALWRKVDSPNDPRPFSGFGFVFDEVRQRGVLFGGLRSLFYEEATWLWDGFDWTQASAGPGPRGGYRMDYDRVRDANVLIAPATRGTEVWHYSSRRWQRHAVSQSTPWWEWPAFAFDPSSGEAVRFGGYDIPFNRVVDETWTWNGSAWQRRFPTVAPEPRMRTAMAYDPVRGALLLFGGVGATYLDDTWSWDGSTWQRLSPAQSPPGRAQHALALDWRRQRIVLFGGFDGSAAVADTWEWDGVTWRAMQPAHAPPPSFEHGMTYDRARQRVVLFGGVPGNGATWEWDGVDWHLRLPATAPRGRADFAIGYDPQTERVVLFGGTRTQPLLEVFADTWELGPTVASAYASFASGCAGTQSVPVLAARDDTRPWLGEILEVTVSQLPAVSAVVLSFGVSDRTWRGVSLPLDLGSIGMDGCALAVSADWSFWKVATGGVAAFAFAVPLDPALLGGRFYNQAWVSDPGANALGVVISNARAGVIGTR